jgi:hypothetical protein
LSAVRLTFGGLTLLVTNRDPGAGYERIENMVWINQNKNTIARSIAQSTRPYLFGINFGGMTHEEKVDWVENNIGGRGLEIYVKFVPHTMDPLVGIAGSMVFSLSQQQTLPGHLLIDNAPMLQRYARAIGAFVTARYDAFDTWYGTDVTNMDAMQRTQFIADEILQGRLFVFIPDP